MLYGTAERSPGALSPSAAQKRASTVSAWESRATSVVCVVSRHPLTHADGWHVSSREGGGPKPRHRPARGVPSQRVGGFCPPLAGHVRSNPLGGLTLCRTLCTRFALCGLPSCATAGSFHCLGPKAGLFRGLYVPVSPP